MDNSKISELEDAGKKIKLYLLDEKFKDNKLRYAAQSILASVVLAFVLLWLDSFIDFVIISALGATTFILFAMPQQSASIPRRVIGGYITGIVVGKTFLFLLNIIEASIQQNILVNIFGAISVGITIFLMTIINTEHPPAVGVSLVIILHGYEWRTLLLIVVAVILLKLVQSVLKKWLIDLL